MKWSYSGLKDFLNCPRMYYEVKVAQNFTKKITEQMTYGTDTHKAFEEYVRDGTPLPKNYQRYQPIMDAVCSIPGEKHLELKMALNENLEPCDFDDPNYFVRGINDFMAIEDDTACIIDYKSGNPRYADTKQLKLMGIMAFAHFPFLRRIKAGLLFFAHNVFIPDNDYVHTEPGKSYLWTYFEPDLRRLKMAFDDDYWPVNPTGLCGWCPVKTCQHYRSK